MNAMFFGLIFRQNMDIEHYQDGTLKRHFFFAIEFENRNDQK